MEKLIRNLDEPLRANERSRFVRIGWVTPSQNVDTIIKDLDFDTILFIGSGAIENSWRPIADLCSEIINGKFGGLTNYKTNNSYYYNEPYDHFLTAIAFTETAIRNNLARLLENPAFSSSHSFKLYGNATATREKLAQFFDKDCSLKLRLFDASKFSINYERTLVVTSNWDNCVWASPDFKNVVYLHGHCKIENSLVLPTQFVTDEFPLKHWIDLRLRAQDPNVTVVRANATKLVSALKAIPQFANPKNQRDLQLELNYAHDFFRETISSEKCKRLFLWGYGFNLYDAEVNLLLTLCSQMHHPQVDILNPDPMVLIKAAQVLAREINQLRYHHPNQ